MLPFLLMAWLISKLVLAGMHPGLSHGDAKNQHARARNTLDWNLSRGVAQPGSASALGAEGRGFESLRPDHHIHSASPLA